MDGEKSDKARVKEPQQDKQILKITALYLVALEYSHAQDSESHRQDPPEQLEH
jgi:acyl-CoA thioesterase